jgi:hypothetical protein
MNPIAHLELSWLAAQPLRHRRDRILVAAAGVIPDVDGLSILAGKDFYGTWHHVLTHGYVAAAVVTVAAAAAAKERVKTAALALFTFHLHLMCDLVGSGPGWPLFYFWPTSDRSWYWSAQWNLASWQNSVIATIASLACLAMAFPFRRTIVEIFSTKADALVVKALWLRFRKARGRELGILTETDR